MKAFFFSLVATLGLAIGGCHWHTPPHHPHHPHGGPPGHRRVVVVERGHSCSAHCGHYYYQDTWYAVDEGHVHGHGCGHVRRKRIWVIAD